MGARGLRPQRHLSRGRNFSHGTLERCGDWLGIGRWHAERRLETPNTRLVALCDVDARRLAEAKERYGVEKTCASYEELGEDPDVEAVSVCVPNHLHTPIGVDALGRGEHVLCEKPLANSVAHGGRWLPRRVAVIVSPWWR